MDIFTVVGKDAKACGYDRAIDIHTKDIELLPCPFCGAKPLRYVSCDILHISCPECVSVGFHNHVRFGCRADSEWNRRSDLSAHTNE